MSVRLLIAPAGHGKTHNAIERIRALKASDPLAPVTVILPNQIRVAEFRARLAAAGGALGVNLTTFHTLYADLLIRADTPKARLTDPVQIRLLRSIVEQLCAQGQLSHFAPLRGKPGFMALLRDTIEELKRARLYPEVFLSTVMGLGPRLEELVMIYAAYQDWLQREDWADNEGQGWLAAISLEDHNSLGSEIRLLVVNGFDEFNPTQLGVLTILTQRAHETIITLTGDLTRDRLAHRRFLRAQHTLSKALDLKPEPLNIELRTQNTELTAIENSLFENPKSKVQNPKSIEFLEAQNRSEEARAALRWIKLRVVRDGLALSEVALLARNLDPYYAFLEETAAEFGLPLRVIGGTALMDNPAIAALISLLSLPVLDWPRRQVLEAWRSPYFDWAEQGITSSDAAALDTLSRAGQVMGGLAQWREAFDLLAHARSNDPTIDDEDEARFPFSLEETLKIQDKFERFVERLGPPPAGTLREFVAFVEDLMGDDSTLSPSPFSQPAEGTGAGIILRALDNPTTATRDIAALQTLQDVLRGLMLAEETLGNDQSIEYAEFFQELRGSVEAATYSPAREAEGVLVASVLDARGLSFRAVALIGLSEGEFPKAEREDILLRESDRALLRERGLSIESKLRGDEATFFYQAVTRARERLVLCRPYLADDGQAWEPSPYWLQVQRLMGEPSIKKIRSEDALSPAEAASPIEFMQAARQFDRHLERGRQLLRQRLLTDRDGELPELRPDLAARFAPSHGWSASRLEAYGTCGYYFYVAHALELEPRTPPEAGFDVRILGTMLHKILEDTYQRAEAAIDLDACLRVLPAVARAVFDAAPREYGFRPTAWWQWQRQELERSVRDTIVALFDVSAGYTPRYFEQRFGLGQPALVLHTDDGGIRLHGYIDRVDVAANGHLRVIDYKSGSTPIGAVQLIEGRRLQLPLYALAACEALKLGEIDGGFYWHIQSARASSLKLEKFEGGIDAAIDTAVQHVIAHVRSIRAGHFRPVPPSDGCPGYCPAIGFCWRYTSKAY
jgi:ATP-dependent helicase/nuclease subunit B